VIGIGKLAISGKAVSGMIHGTLVVIGSGLAAVGLTGVATGAASEVVQIGLTAPEVVAFLIFIAGVVPLVRAYFRTRDVVEAHTTEFGKVREEAAKEAAAIRKEIEEKIAASVTDRAKIHDKLDRIQDQIAGIRENCAAFSHLAELRKITGTLQSFGKKGEDVDDER
jgi:hypothetical protein